MSVVSVVYCKVAVSATSWLPVQRSPTECGVTECDHEATIMRRCRPARGCRTIGKKFITGKCCFTGRHPHLPFVGKSVCRYTITVNVNTCCQPVWYLTRVTDRDVIKAYCRNKRSVKFFYSPTNAQVNCLKNSIEIYIKTAATCFGAVTPSSGRALLVLAEVTVVKIVNYDTSAYEWIGGDVPSYTVFARVICALFFIFWPLKNRGA